MPKLRVQLISPVLIVATITLGVAGLREVESHSICRSFALAVASESKTPLVTARPHHSRFVCNSTMSADYLLYEGPMGYSIFKVVHQADTVGNRLKEVQDSVQDLARFGKMVNLVSFLPFEYALLPILVLTSS